MNKVYAYKRTAVRRTRQEPELALQIAVKRFLLLVLPEEVEWTSLLSGAHLGPSQRSRMKASGLRPGFPDLVFVYNQRTYWIELKAEGGRLSPDQKRVMGRMHPGACGVCRSVDEASLLLKAWGFPLRAHSLTARTAPN